MSEKLDKRKVLLVEDDPDFTRLVLGHLDWDQALSDGRMQPSTNIALCAGRALFPTLPLWFPPFDNLPSRE